MAHHLPQLEGAEGDPTADMSERRRGSSSQPIMDRLMSSENKEMTDVIKNVVTVLFSGDKVDSDILDAVRRVLKNDFARMELARTLDEQRCKEQGYLLESSAFMVMKNLLWSLLDESARSEDYKPVKLVMNMANTYYRAREGGGSGSTTLTTPTIMEASESDRNSAASAATAEIDREYLQEHLRRHPVWRETRFWDDAFYDAVTTERERKDDYQGKKWVELGESEQLDLEEREQNITFGQLGSFVVSMLSYGVPTRNIRRFIVKMATINKLSIEYRDMLLATLEVETKDSEPQVPRKPKKSMFKKWFSSSSS